MWPSIKGVGSGIRRVWIWDHSPVIRYLKPWDRDEQFFFKGLGIMLYHFCEIRPKFVTLSESRIRNLGARPCCQSNSSSAWLFSDSENLSGILVGHTDAVWDLAVQTGSLQLLSASADGTCRLWSPTLKSPLLNNYIPEQGKS